MLRHIDQVEFTIFDTETTGLNPHTGDRIVEIAGVRFKGTERIATFQSLINPQRPISEAAFAVNKITPEMLVDAPTSEKVMPKFLDFILGSCLCSYNAVFDLDFLNNELQAAGRNPLQGFIIIDVLKMARRLLPGLKRYALWFVASHLEIKTQQAHRAFSDVELTLAVFNKLRSQLKEKEIVDFGSFVHLFSINTNILDDLNAQKIARIQEAMDLGVALKMRYLSTSSAQVSEREVIPKAIKQENNRSYLVGFCRLRNEERSFRVDSIMQLEVVQEK